MKLFNSAALIFFSILSIHSYIITTVITPEEIIDLQIVQTYQGTPGFIKTLNKTISGTGTDYLKKRVLNPITCKEQLSKRQHAITLIGDTQCAATIGSLLNKFKKHEQGLYSFTRSQDPIAKQAIDNLYFKNRAIKKLNAYPAGLDLAQIIHGINLMAPVAEHAAIHFFVNEALHEYLGMCCSHSHHDHGHDKHKEKAHKHKKHDHEHKHKTPPSKGAVWAYKAYNVAHTLIHFMNLKELFEHFQNQSATLHQMQEQLIELRRCLDAAKELVAITGHMPADTFENQLALRAVATNDSTLISPELSELITLLEKNTFSASASFFSRPGNILRAYTLALSTIPELLEAFTGVGELDTLLSCNKLLQSTDANQPFCMATFIEQNKPHIKIHHYWNLLNATPSPIEQELILGNTHPHVAIITGVNKSGKSTASSALAQAIICAQSLGIAPSQQLELTLFAAVRTCFNATTKVIDGKSLFSTSIEFADSVLELNRTSSGFTFIATDELFNSTEFSRGSQINEQMARLLAASSNTIGLISTHFASATKLEKLHPNTIINLKASSSDSLDGVNYHITRGTCDAQNPLELINKSELLIAAGLQ
jgi:DNA mismatch repair ATPase MutS